MSKEYQQANIIVELAAIAAYHGEAFLKANHSISARGIEAYWLASRNRLDKWGATLKRLEVQARMDREPSPSEVQTQWEQLQPLAEEILSSEVLTRIWTAIGCEFDRQNEGSTVEPFVRSILISHLDVRQRLLRLIFNKLQLRPESLRTIDRMRRSAERWTDVLLGYVAKCCRINEFAFDADRVLDFASSLKSQNTPPESVKSLLMVSLRSTFKTSFTTACPNAELNSEVCEAVLACYGNDLFDSVGKFQSLWQVRMANAAEDTLGMIECLTSEHSNHFPSERLRENPAKRN